MEKVAEYFQTIVGRKTETYLGEITPLLIRRYALAIDDHNPLYHDREFAQQNGYPDIIAPPNLLASIVEFGVGANEKELHPDGTPSNEGLLPREFEGVRVMGGGEEKIFYCPVAAGTHVTLTSEITDTYMKQGKKGLIAIIVFTNQYKDQTGKILLICKRSVIAR